MQKSAFLSSQCLIFEFLFDENIHTQEYYFRIATSDFPGQHLRHRFDVENEYGGQRASQGTLCGLRFGNPSGFL